MGYERCLGCGAVAAAEARMEIIAKAKPFIEAEAITVNANTTVESGACSGIDMGATHSRSTSSDP